MRPTGQALARVRQPHRRIAPRTHVLTVRSEAGESFELQGTAEHPFWVPEAGAWVPMEALEPGDSLSADGVRSVVVDRRVAEGDAEVFNVEVALPPAHGPPGCAVYARWPIGSKGAIWLVPGESSRAERALVTSARSE